MLHNPPLALGAPQGLHQHLVTSIKAAKLNWSTFPDTKVCPKSLYLFPAPPWRETSKPQTLFFLSSPPYKLENISLPPASDQGMLEEKGKLFFGFFFFPKSLLTPAIAARLLFLLQKSGPAKPFLNCEGKLAVICEKCRVNRLALPKHV